MPADPAAAPDASSCATFAQVDQAAFRRTMGQFLTGVTIVGVTDPATGLVHGMTANAFLSVSVSLEPPLILVSVGGATHTHRILERSVNFGVSILRDGQERLALHMAGKQVRPGGFEFTGAEAGPVLTDCLASVSADIVSATRAGDHTLFVGQVTRLRPGTRGAQPLGYHRGRFVAAGPPTGEWPVSIADAWAGSLRSGWG